MVAAVMRRRVSRTPKEMPKIERAPRDLASVGDCAFWDVRGDDLEDIVAGEWDSLGEGLRGDLNQLKQK